MTRTIAKFQRELGAMGYRFQFITLAGFHALNYSMFELARGYKTQQMTAYVALQQAEFAAETKGYTATKHQREVGRRLLRRRDADGRGRYLLDHGTGGQHRGAAVPQGVLNGAPRPKRGRLGPRRLRLQPASDRGQHAPRQLAVLVRTGAGRDRDRRHAGGVVPAVCAAAQAPGDGFIKLIRLLIAPIIFCTVVTGIAGMARLQGGRQGRGLALLYFEVVSTLALVIGLVIVEPPQTWRGRERRPGDA